MTRGPWYVRNENIYKDLQTDAPTQGYGELTSRKWTEGRTIVDPPGTD